MVVISGRSLGFFHTGQDKSSIKVQEVSPTSTFKIDYQQRIMTSEGNKNLKSHPIFLQTTLFVHEISPKKKNYVPPYYRFSSLLVTYMNQGFQTTVPPIKQKTLVYFESLNDRIYDQNSAISCIGVHAVKERTTIEPHHTETMSMTHLFFCTKKTAECDNDRNRTTSQLVT